MSFPFFHILLFSSLFISLGNAFSFTTTTQPTQCGDLKLSWTGGNGPFQLLITPLSGTPRNVSIPDSAFKNNAGSFTTQLPLAKDAQFLLSMSDLTGFGTGGSTNILTVGAPAAGSNCNITDPGPSFFFQLNSALQQCRPYVFSGYDKAVQPVTIIGIVPGGTSLVLSPPAGPLDFTWNANVAQGVSLVFLLVDAQGRQGGGSDVKVVGFSDDKSCLNAQSPSTTPASQPKTSSSASTTSKPSSAPSSSSSASPSGTSIGAIAGTVIGALVFLAVVITLGLFFLRRRQDTSKYKRNSHRLNSEVDLTYDPDHSKLQTYPNSPGTGNQAASNFSPNTLHNPHTFPETPNSDYSLTGAANLAHSSSPYTSFDPRRRSLTSSHAPSVDYQPPHVQPPSQHQPPPQFQTVSPYQQASQFHSPLYQQASQFQTPSPYQQASQFQTPTSYQNPSQYPSPPQPQSPNQYQSSAQYHTPQAPVQHSQLLYAGAGAQRPVSGYQPSEYPDDFDPYAADSMAPVTESVPPPHEAESSRRQSGTTTTTTTTVNRKAAEAGYSSYKPSRFIVHTDVEDALPSPDEDGVVELPPQYSERRGPPPSQGSTSNGGKS